MKIHFSKSKNKKGAQGIGTLIIFIALILVAAVAAGVLISTVGKLQGKAEVTGTEVQQRIATGFTVIQIGVNGTDDGDIDSGETIEMRVRLAPGADAVKFADTTIVLLTSRDSFSYSFAGTGNSASTTQFSASSITGSISDGYVGRDDAVELQIRSADTTAIGESE